MEQRGSQRQPNPDTARLHVLSRRQTNYKYQHLKEISHDNQIRIRQRHTSVMGGVQPVCDFHHHIHTGTRHLPNYGRPSENLPWHKPARDPILNLRAEYRGDSIRVRRRMDRYKVQQHETAELDLSVLRNRGSALLLRPEHDHADHTQFPYRHSVRNRIATLHSLHRRSFQRRAAHQTVRLHIGSAQRRAYGVGDRHRLSGQDMVETPLPDLPPSARATFLRAQIQELHQGACGHPQQRRLEKRRTQGTLQILATGQHPDARPLLHLLLRDNSCNSRNQPLHPVQIHQLRNGRRPHLDTVPRNHGIGLYPQLVSANPQEPCGDSRNGADSHRVPADGYLRRSRDSRYRYPDCLLLLRHSPALLL